jgi:hypothetical protein
VLTGVLRHGQPPRVAAGGASMSIVEAATATTQAVLLALAVFAAGVIVGWVLRSVRLEVQKARHARTLFTDEEFEVLYRSLHPELPSWPAASKKLHLERAANPHVDQWVRDRHRVRAGSSFVHGSTRQGGGSR